MHDVEDAEPKAPTFERTHSKDSSKASIRSGSSDTQVEPTGVTNNEPLVPRERFSYWCLDLLFLVCSNTAKGAFVLFLSNYVMLDVLLCIDNEKSRQRVAALCLPSLLHRCGTTLLGYLADEVLRGNYPFPRYVIRLTHF